MKKLSKFLLLAIGALSLSACDQIMDLFGGLKVYLNYDSYDLTVGKSVYLVASYSKSDYEPTNVTWSFDVEDIVKLKPSSDVSKCQVTGVHSGKSTVTVNVDGKTAKCDFTVPKGTLEKIELESYTTSFEVGDTYKFDGQVNATYSNKEVIDVTSQTTFSSVDMSTKGSKEITASYKDGAKTATAKFSIFVYAKGEKPAVDKSNLLYNFQDYKNNNYYSESACPSTGTAKLLVIPVWFNNSSSYVGLSSRERVREDIRKAYFGTNEETGWRSVKTYYEEESHGALTISGVVSEWYECGNNSSAYYTSTNATSNLLKSAVNWYFAQPSADSKDSFDCDNDGFLDGVMLIYCAPDYQAERSENDNMWAYCYWTFMNKGTTTNPNPNAFFWASYDFMYGSSYKVGNYTNGDNSHCVVDTHTFIHEMGHIFGLMDYYDYESQYKPAGAFSMQDYNVGGHDPFSSMALGWSKPYVPTTSVTLEIKDFQSSGDIILLSPNFTGSPFDEYILIELYTPTGLNAFDVANKYDRNYPQGPNKTGIRIWHVNKLLYSYRTYRTTTNPNDGSVDSLCTNTTGSNNGHSGMAGYTQYNELFLMGPTLNSYNRSRDFDATDLWQTGGTFSMSQYANQFYRNGKLDNGLNLGFEVTFKSVSSKGALVQITKL